MEAEVLLDKLSYMSPDEIADLCRERQIRGARAIPLSCPLAHLFRKETGLQVSVGMVAIGWSRQVARTPLPNSVHLFVAAFDRGRYPDLEEEG